MGAKKRLVFSVIAGMALAERAMAVEIPECLYTKEEIATVDGAKSVIDRLRHGGCLEKLRQTEACLAKAALLSENVAGILKRFSRRSDGAPLFVTQLFTVRVRRRIST